MAVCAAREVLEARAGRRPWDAVVGSLVLTAVFAQRVAREPSGLRLGVDPPAGSNQSRSPFCSRSLECVGVGGRLRSDRRGGVDGVHRRQVGRLCQPQQGWGRDVSAPLRVNDIEGDARLPESRPPA